MILQSVRYSGFRQSFVHHEVTAWSWLGVIVYLTREQIRETLQQLAELSSPRSVLVADFVLDQSLMG
jgi:O-methyltransferase involved in polyketide biosynthesis